MILRLLQYPMNGDFFSSLVFAPPSLTALRRVVKPNADNR